jgi:hypothetical protein
MNNQYQYLSVEDLHQIRYENYERTKHMTHEELIADTNSRADEARKKMQEVLARAENVSDPAR